jgi:hypothetical protein
VPGLIGRFQRTGIERPGHSHPALLVQSGVGAARNEERPPIGAEGAGVQRSSPDAARASLYTGPHVDQQDPVAGERSNAIAAKRSVVIDALPRPLLPSTALEEGGALLAADEHVYAVGRHAAAFRGRDTMPEFEHLARTKVVSPHDAVGGCGEHYGRVGRGVAAPDLVRQMRDTLDVRPAFGSPHPDGTVVAAAEEVTAVSGERAIEHRIGVAEHRRLQDRIAVGQVETPEPGRRRAFDGAARLAHRTAAPEVVRLLVEEHRHRCVAIQVVGLAPDEREERLERAQPSATHPQRRFVVVDQIVDHAHHALGAHEPQIAQRVLEHRPHSGVRQMKGHFGRGARVGDLAIRRCNAQYRPAAEKPRQWSVRTPGVGRGAVAMRRAFAHHSMVEAEQRHASASAPRQVGRQVGVEPRPDGNGQLIGERRFWRTTTQLRQHLAPLAQQPHHLVLAQPESGGPQVSQGVSHEHGAMTRLELVECGVHNAVETLRHAHVAITRGPSACPLERELQEQRQRTSLEAGADRAFLRRLKRAVRGVQPCVQCRASLRPRQTCQPQGRSIVWRRCVLGGRRIGDRCHDLCARRQPSGQPIHQLDALSVLDLIDRVEEHEQLARRWPEPQDLEPACDCGLDVVRRRLRRRVERGRDLFTQPVEQAVQVRRSRGRTDEALDDQRASVRCARFFGRLRHQRAFAASRSAEQDERTVHIVGEIPLEPPTCRVASLESGHPFGGKLRMCGSLAG